MYVCDILDKQVRPRFGEPLTCRAAASFVAPILLARHQVSVFHRKRGRGADEACAKCFTAVLFGAHVPSTPPIASKVDQR